MTTEETTPPVTEPPKTETPPVTEPPKKDDAPTTEDDKLRKMVREELAKLVPSGGGVSPVSRATMEEQARKMVEDAAARVTKDQEDAEWKKKVTEKVLETPPEVMPKLRKLLWAEPKKKGQ